MNLLIDLQACQNESGGRGIGRYAMAMTKAMIRHGGHQITVALSAAFADGVMPIRRELEGLLPQERIVVFSPPSRTSSANLENAWRCRAAEVLRAKFFEDLAPDAVFNPSLMEGWWDRVISSVEPGSYVNAVTVHDFIPLDYPDRHLTAPAEREAYLRKLQSLRGADVLLAISDFVRKETVRHLGVPASKVVLAPNGVDEKFRVADKHAPVCSMERFGITRPFILNTSPLEYRKNVDGLIAGFASLPRALKANHQLVIVGKMDAHARRHVADAAAREGLARDMVVLPGFVTDDELIAFYRQCELFVFPSLSEGFGLPILEAMACGAPSLGSDATSIPEVVARKDMLFDPTDATSIADAMARVLKDDVLRSDIRKHGLKRAKVFSWDKAAHNALIAIEDAVAKRRASIVAQTATPKPRQPTLALVSSSLAPQSRLAGYVATLVAGWEGPYRVTLMADDEPDNQSTRAVVERRSLGWFCGNAEKFDRIVYVLDVHAPSPFLDLMKAAPGAALLLDASAENTAGEMPGMAQQALWQQEGYGAFVGEHSTSRDPGVVQCAVEAMLKGASLGLLSDGSEPVSALPIRLSNAAGASLRDDLGIAPDTKVLLAFAPGDDAKDEIIRIFRAANAQQKTKAHLILCVRGMDSTPVEAKTNELFGAVHVLRDPHRIYRGLLSVADAVLLPSKSAWSLARLARLDLKSAATPVVDYSNDIRRACESGMAAVGRASPSLAAESHQAATQAVTLLSERLEGLYATPVICPAQDFAERLSSHVRKVPADALDLAEVAIAYDQSASVRRPAAIYLDLSALAGSRRGGRLDLRRRAVLLEILKAAGPNFRAIYSRDNRFYAADRYLGRLVGLQRLDDDEEAINFTAGDRIVGVEDLNGFGPESTPALRAAEVYGAGLFYVTLGDLVRSRPELIADGIALVLQLVAAPNLSVQRRVLTRTTSRLRLGQEARMAVERMVADDLGIDLIAVATLGQSDTDVPVILGEFEHWPVGSAITSAWDAFEARQNEPQSVNAGILPNPSNLDYTVTGHIGGTYSLAMINRALSRTFEAAYPNQVRIRAVETTPIDNADDVPALERPQVAELMARPAATEGREVLISQHYPLLAPVGEPLIALSVFAWEETHVPPSTVATLGEYFDAVIAPSRFVEKALIDSGLRIPVAAIGQPADIARYHVLGRARSQRPRIATFLHVSSCFPRKGADVLLAAWAKAFTASDGVRLIIKTFPNRHNHVEKWVAAQRKSHPKLAPIEIINRDVDLDDMLALYEKADALVLPTRGEGYNLPALEAMAAGVPLIVTDYGGHSDFCGPDEARMIRSTFALSASHVRDGVSQWVEPDVDDLAAALREFVDPRSGAAIEHRRQRALDVAGAVSVHDAWLKRHEQLVTELLGAPPAVEPRVGWISTWGVQCGVAQYSTYLLNRLPQRTRDNVVVLCDDRTPTSFVSDLSFKPCWRFGPTGNGPRLAAAIDAAGCDVVVLQHQEGLVSWKDLAALCRDSRFISRTTVVVLHNPRNLLRLAKDDLDDVVAALSQVDRLLVHAVIDVNLLKSLGLVTNVALLPHGATSAKSTGWPRDFSKAVDPVIGSHGFFFRHKGIDKLIRAAALLREEWPGLKLRLVNARFPDGSSDPLIAECKVLAQSLGMADAIEWHTEFLPIDEINDLLSGCDLVVLPYDESDDSASGAVRLALSSMAPLVATRVKIFSEIGDAAAWAQSNDPEELLKTIAPLLRSTASRRELQEAMNGWLKAHDWGRIATTLDGLIHNLAQRRQLGWD